jgi:hypothetical protein
VRSARETQYLQEELRKLQRASNIALVAMAIIIVATFAYFGWLRSQLASVLTPDSISEFLVSETRGVLPDVTESLQANIKDKAPAMVHYMLSQAVDHTLPLVAQTFEANLEEHTRGVSAIGGDNAMSALEAALRAYKAQPGRPKKETAEALAPRLAVHIEAQMPLQLDLVAKDGVKAQLSKTGGTLKHINQELTSMAQGRSQDRTGELGKQLITTWWSFLDSGRPKQPHDMLDAANAAKTANTAKTK